MPRPTSIPARVAADTYATRVVLIEFLEMMQRANPGTIDALRNNLEHSARFKPSDISLVSEADIRDAAKMILEEAIKL